MTPIPFSDEDLDGLSLITEGDILIAHQAAVKAMSKPFKNLLLALPQDAFNTEPNTRSDFTGLPIQRSGQ
jgi:hypothetical protein